MSFPRYPEYKDSGVEWLGEVPAHWTATAIRTLARPGVDTFIDGDWIEAPYITDEGVRLIQTGNIGIGHFKEQGFRFVSEQTFHELRCTEVEPGNVLISRLADPVGRSCLAPDLGAKAITSVDVAILKLATTHCASFVVYLLSSAHYLGYLDGQCRGGTRDRVSRSFLGNVRIGLPPKNEQIAIATFLDREISKIDALVAEQEKLIALLKEKRQAVISHAVTKGLNPDAPMKPSGIEWLGDVPAHWEVKQFRRSVFIAEGQVDPEVPPYNDMALIAPNHVESGTGRLLELETAEQQGAESGKYLCAAGDVVYSKIRPALRKVCIAPATCLCSADMYPLRCHNGLTGQYLLWFLLSEQFSSLAVLESERVAMPKINRETLNEISILSPPEREQGTISDHLCDATESIDSLSREAEAVIALLKERRSALISAAITGQIDVRGLASGPVVAAAEPCAVIAT